MTTKKSSSQRAPAKAATKAQATKATAKSKAAAPRSMPKGGKDPKGGLTAAGRRFFNQKEGSHLRPGVQGPADTPEKMVRKGSFLRRHFAHPRGPMKDDKGEPTRLALSAHAWGELVPQTMGDARKLATEGHELLEQYHAVKEGRAAATKRGAGGGSAKRAATKVVVKKAAPKAARKAAAKKTPGKKVAGKKTAAKPAGERKGPASRGKGSAPAAARKGSHGSRRSGPRTDR